MVDGESTSWKRRYERRKRVERNWGEGKWNHRTFAFDYEITTLVPLANYLLIATQHTEGGIQHAEVIILDWQFTEIRRFSVPASWIGSIHVSGDRALCSGSQTQPMFLCNWRDGNVLLQIAG